MSRQPTRFSLFCRPVSLALLGCLLAGCDQELPTDLEADVSPVDARWFRELLGGETKLVGAVGSTAYITRDGRIEAIDAYGVAWFVPVAGLHDAQLVDGALHGLALVGCDDATSMCQWRVDVLSPIDGEPVGPHTDLHAPAGVAPTLNGANDFLRWEPGCKLARIVDAEPMWTTTTLGESCDIQPVRTADDGAVVQLSTAGSTRVAVISSGEIAWELGVDAGVAVDAVDVDGSLTVVGPAAVRFVDADGTDWTVETGHAPRTIFSADGEIVVTYWDGDRLVVEGRAREDGALLWDGELGTGYEGMVVTELAADAGTIFVGSHGGGSDASKYWLASFAVG